MNSFHFAEEYYQRGYSVVPLKGKKTPRGFGWKKYQVRRTTLDELRTWFRPNSTFNVGIVTGAVSDLVVIDCDSRQDEEWWRAHLPGTPMVCRTGSGGAHFYYRGDQNAMARNRTHVFGRKIDVRGNGGLVVAPPSIHPETKEVYGWEPWGYRSYYGAEEIPVFDPDWVADREKSTRTEQPVACYRQGGRIRNGPRYISRIHAVSGQNGHGATYRAAASLRDAGLSADEAFQALIAWNETNCEPPWTRAELLHKVEDVFEA